MSVAGIIFSNIHDSNLSELTGIRTIASVPFGCRYRLIDFTLSNMVNSNIKNISLITNNNYNSLIDHIGTGKDWDLARRSGGIKFFPPNVMTYTTGYTAGVGNNYDTRLGAMKTLLHMISHMTDDYVVLSDCDVICNIDIGAIVDEHIATGADMTIAVKNMVVDSVTAASNSFVKSSDDGRLIDVIAHPSEISGSAEMMLSIIVLSRKYLCEVVQDAIAHGYTSFARDVIARNFPYRNYRVYRYDGYFACVSSLEQYFKENMALLDGGTMFRELFEIPNRPIYTKVRNSAPTYYSEYSSIKNSMIADGCVIDGTVENCILFRGVKIGRGAVVKNSILFQDVYTGSNTSLNYVVADKNVVIRDDVMLCGHSSQPFYIEKGKMI
ncbi:MAG: glucose-1-phosphate adenylyltransferase subunit GlgD [Clostridia bacterium]|nr:glucose-1-phosphate adenylyltransferase subunit GlgD [Clostridia bacterium]